MDDILSKKVWSDLLDSDLRSQCTLPPGPTPQEVGGPIRYRFGRAEDIQRRIEKK